MKQKLYIAVSLAFAGAVAVAQTTSPGGAGAGTGNSVTPPVQGTTGAGAVTPGQGAGATPPGAFLPPQVSSTGTRTVTPGGLQTNNQFGTTSPDNATVTAQFAQNVNTAQLAARLASLQAEIQATLPLLATVSQDPASIGGVNQPVTNAYVGGSGLGARTAVGQGSTIARGIPPRVISPRSTAPVQGGPANQATVGTGTQTGLGAGATTQNVSAETFRALVVLRNDLERMLPVLNSLNQGGVFALSGTTSGSVGASPGIPTRPLNRFDPQAPAGSAPPVQTPQAPLAPTGR